MKLLLDSHALIWYTHADPKLSEAAGRSIRDASNEVLLSAASLWEISVKAGLGKLRLRSPFDAFIDICVKDYGFTWLPIEPRHLVEVGRLPFHHRDPFDRMLIAQALTDDLTLVSTDTAIDAYAVQRLW